MNYYEITYKLVFWYEHEPSPTSAKGWQSGEVKEVDGAYTQMWEVRYENTEGGNWDSREKFVEHLEEKMEDYGPEAMLQGCIDADYNWDHDYDGCELEIE